MTQVRKINTFASPISNVSGTGQKHAIPGREQEMAINNAGGVSFKLDRWDILDRFLILGSDRAKYQANSKGPTKADAERLVQLVDEDGERFVNRIVEISDAGRAPKNDPALFALALAASAKNDKTRKLAINALPKVARIGTHLFHYASYVEQFRGWGRALRRGIADWYLQQPIDSLALQVIKYQQRDGWSNRDLLRLSHPKTNDQVRNNIFKWIVSGTEGLTGELHQQIVAFEQAKAATSEQQILDLIRDHNLPREAIPTQWLNSPKVWEALLVKMPLTAMIRNLAKMTSIGLIDSRSDSAKKVISMLSNQEILKRSRIHPLNVLMAFKTYSLGHGIKGKLTWKPVQGILDGLDSAFYNTFSNVEPTGKRHLLAVDCSGSMDSNINQDMALTCRDAAAAMALVIANVEPACEIVGFSSGGNAGGWKPSASAKRTGFWGNRGSGMLDLKISPTQRLDEVSRKMQRVDWGGTDCSLPFRFAKDTKREVDAFVVITDNDTWAGEIQPVEALDQYRKSSGIAAKTAVLGMTASDFTIADPKDAGMMDFVGMDTAVPSLMSDFFKD